MTTAIATVAADPGTTADLERRFGGLRRLYGEVGYARLRASRVAVVGLGGVGSWAVEALARSGVAGLVLIDFDHVAESNVNRQVHALDVTMGQAKVDALADRIASIHPGCEVRRIDDFATEANWPALLPCEVDVVIDACDDTRAKAAIAGGALKGRYQLVMSGAAGGKRRPQAVEVADLAEVTHDPLLAAVRQRLRRQTTSSRADGVARRRWGIGCVFSREPVQRAPVDACAVPSNSLNCNGFGSSVAVTAAFGLAAAAQAIELVVAEPLPVAQSARAAHLA